MSNISPNEVRYLFGTHHISTLEGKVLTLLDASIQDREQRKALKDIFRQEIWNWAIGNNQDRDHEHNKVMMNPESVVPAGE